MTNKIKITLWAKESSTMSYIQPMACPGRHGEQKGGHGRPSPCPQGAE